MPSTTDTSLHLAHRHRNRSIQQLHNDHIHRWRLACSSRAISTRLVCAATRTLSRSSTHAGNRDYRTTERATDNLGLLSVKYLARLQGTTIPLHYTAVLQRHCHSCTPAIASVSCSLRAVAPPNSDAMTYTQLSTSTPPAHRHHVDFHRTITIWLVLQYDTPCCDDQPRRDVTPTHRFSSSWSATGLSLPVVNVHTGTDRELLLTNMVVCRFRHKCRAHSPLALSAPETRLPVWQASK